MRSSSVLLLAVTFAVCVPSAFAAGTEADCPITQAPAQPFAPPLGYSLSRGSFAFGTPELWVDLNPHWRLNRQSNKMPFFSEDFIYGKSEPRLVVVARQLDSPTPLIWSDLVSDGNPLPRIPNNHGFMVTGLPIPTIGCWEITARYSPASNKNYTLTYTVWVGQ